MKRFLTLLATAVCLSASSAFGAQNSYYNYVFAENSLLSTGKWVKITVGESGIYEIDDATLSAMGFSNPEAVSVVGSGGLMMNRDFTTNRFERLYEDNPPQVPVIHSNGKLFFYAQGPEQLEYDVDKVRFVRSDLNIYTDKGYYFLTDALSPLTMSKSTVTASETAAQRTDLTSYAYHEKDLCQNNTSTGQTFWGEDLLAASRYEWPLELKFIDTSGYAKLEVGAYLAAGGSDSNIRFGNGSTNYDYIYRNNNAPGFSSSTSYAFGQIPAEGKVKVVIEPVNLKVRDFAAVDYWILNYFRKFNAEMTPDFVQETVAIWKSNSVTAGADGYIAVPEGAKVLEITDSSAPVELNVEDGKAYFANGHQTHTFITFDPAKPQKQIGADYKVVENSNLHALKGQGIDFAIVTVPEYLKQAEQIAELHRKNDGLNVVVVTASQLYDEFSHGKPDPMAYRAFAKMLYQKQNRPLQNMLLFGPIYGDVRNVLGTERPDFMIAYQQPGVILTDAASPDLDYYGTCTDYIANNFALSNKNVEIGIGNIGVRSQREADLAVSKIRDYMDENSFEWLANETLSIGCPGDGRLHDDMADQARKLLEQAQSRTAGCRPMHYTLINDEYDDIAEASKTYFDELDLGKIFNVYYGHSGPAAYGGSQDFATPTMLRNMTNRNLGFLFLAGCDLSYPDRGWRGIGETGVIDSPRAFIGTIMAARTVQSNWNLDFSKSFMRFLYYQNGSPVSPKPRTEPTTVGQVFCRAKSNVNNPSELNYLLIGDPALRVPVATRKIEVTLGEAKKCKPGDLLTLNCKVLAADKSLDASYNGKAVVKMALPLDSIDIKYSDGSPFYIDFRSVHATSVQADVKNGEFKVQIPVSADFEKYMDSTEPAEGGKMVRLYVSAFSREKFLSSAGYAELPLAAADSEADPAAERDETVPALELAYDNDRSIVSLTATDNVGLTPGVGKSKGVYLEIDGKPVKLDGLDDHGSAVSVYNASIPAINLANGSHKVKGYARDLAGNVSEEVEFTFTKSDIAKLVLSADSHLAIEGISLKLARKAPEGLTVVVIGADGERVKSVPADSDIYIATDDLEVGTYRAAVVHESELGSKYYSNWVEFSVID